MSIAVVDNQTWATLAGAALLIVIGILALAFLRAYEILARRSLARKYVGLEVRSMPNPGDVELVYHTYHGFIAWFSQTQHRAWLPPADARILLGRLLRFNLAWGALTYGSLFVIPLAIASYFGQRRSIARQLVAENVGDGVEPDGVTLPPNADLNPYRAPSIAHPQPTTAGANPPATVGRSLFHSIIGWTCVGLAALFIVTTGGMLIRRDFEPVLGGVFVIVVLLATAKNFLRP